MSPRLSVWAWHLEHAVQLGDTLGRRDKTWPIVENASWSGPAEVKAHFGTADFLAGNHIVFNIKGNTYRLIVQVKYGPLFLVYIRFVGAHAEYDRVDAATI